MQASPSSPHHAHHGACSCHPAPHLAHLADVSNVSDVSSAPSKAGASAGDIQTAETVLTGDIRTMNPAQPTVEAMAVRDGRIVALGSVSDIEGLTDANTKRVQLDGITYPGLVEPHMHYWASALMYDWLNCSPITGKNYDQIVDGLKQAPPTIGDWTLGQLYDPSLIPGNKPLTRDLLDQICPDRPMLVMNASMHYAYVNSAALQAAGIGEGDKDPQGGTFGRDPSGRLDGSLGEIAAMTIALKHVPTLTSRDVLDRVVKISQHAASNGIVRTHDAGTGALFGPKEPQLMFGAKDRLACRVSLAILDQAADVITEHLHPNDGDDWVRATHWKFVTDGSNQGFSGFQKENYLHKNFRGEANYTKDSLLQRMQKAQDLGWPMMVHANGDAAISQAVDCYRSVMANSGTKARNRIEHCSFPSQQNLADMADLGISPSFLMNHVYYWGRAFRDDIVGPEKAAGLDPVASALRHGLRPTFHSDYTVTEMRPLLAAQTAMTRRMRDGGEVLNADECISAADAMKIITRNAAWQLHADDDLGTLEVGKFADVAMFEEDPLTVDPESFGEIPVLGTLVGGEQRS